MVNSSLLPFPVCFMLEQLQSCIYCSIHPAFALSVPPSDFKVDAFSSEANCPQSCIVRLTTAASYFSPAELSLALLPPVGISSQME